MNLRANAILVSLIGVLLVVYWMWPKSLEHVGGLRDQHLSRLVMRDVSGTHFQTSDPVVMRGLAEVIDDAEPIPDVAGRLSRGYFTLVFERERDAPITLEVICHIEQGPVLQEQRNFGGSAMGQLIALLEERFPEGKWCPISAPDEGTRKVEVRP